jgi:O-antigen ligase
VWTAVSAVWLIAAAIFAAWALSHGDPSPIDSKFVALAFLPACGALQLAAGLTVHRPATVNDVLIWTAAAALFPVAKMVLTDCVVRSAFLRWSVLFAVVVSAAALVQFYTSAGNIYWFLPSGQDAVLGPFRNRNHFASFAALLYPTAILSGRRTPDGGSPSWRALAFAATLAAAVAAGGSRAGGALILLETATLLWVIGRKRAGAALLCLLLIAAPVAARWRGDGGRWAIWDSALALVLAKPGLGHGLGAFETAYPAEARFDNGLVVDHAHNDWLEFAVEVGVPSTVPMAGLAIWTMVAVRRHWWALGVPAVFLHALTDYPLHKPALAGWMVVMMAALAAAESQRSTLYEDPFDAPAS